MSSEHNSNPLPFIANNIFNSGLASDGFIRDYDKTHRIIAKSQIYKMPKQTVESCPAWLTSTRSPPGCLLAHVLTSYTYPSMTIHRSAFVTCFRISSQEYSGRESSPFTWASVLHIPHELKKRTTESLSVISLPVCWLYNPDTLSNMDKSRTTQAPLISVRNNTLNTGRPSTLTFTPRLMNIIQSHSSYNLYAFI